MNWIYKDNPCGECQDRPPDKGCGMHSKCDRYLAWVAEKDRRKEQRHMEKKAEKALDEFLIGSNKKRKDKALGGSK